MQTIYSAFGSKARTLSDLAYRVIGPIEPLRQHDEAMAHPDPATGLRLAARIERQQYEVMYDVIAVFQQAALIDPDVASAMKSTLDNREKSFRRHLLAIEEHLRSTVDIALDLYLTLVLPEVYRTLVLERGWSLDQYEAWLGDEFVNLLLPRPRRRRST